MEILWWFDWIYAAQEFYDDLTGFMQPEILWWFDWIYAAQEFYFMAVQSQWPTAFSLSRLYDQIQTHHTP